MSHGMGVTDFLEQAHRAHLEREERRRIVRHRSTCLAKYLQLVSGPCKCSGMKKNSYLYHTYRPLDEPLRDFIERLVEPHLEAPAILVCAASCIARFSEAEGIPLCRDQVLRLASISICVNAKFWDDVSGGRNNVNFDVASAAGVPRDDVNAMELSFLRSLGWNIVMGAEAFEEWAQRIDGMDDTGGFIPSHYELNISPTKSVVSSSGAESDNAASSASTNNYASMSDSDNNSGYGSDHNGSSGSTNRTKTGVIRGSKAKCAAGEGSRECSPFCSALMAEEFLSDDFVALGLHANSLGRRRNMYDDEYR